MRKRFMILFFVALVFMSCAGNTASGVIMDSINATEEPPGNAWLEVIQAGWVYTPDFSYTLTGVLTKFGYKDDRLGQVLGHLRDITVEVYDGLPADADTLLLRQATFSTVLAEVFVGGSFAPLQLTAHEDYFIGFRNIEGMLLNSTSSGLMLPCYAGFEEDGSYPDVVEHIGALHPILQFEGVPEPATVLLLGFGGLILLRKRKRG